MLTCEWMTPQQEYAVSYMCTKLVVHEKREGGREGGREWGSHAAIPRSSSVCGKRSKIICMGTICRSIGMKKGQQVRSVVEVQSTCPPLAEKQTGVSVTAEKHYQALDRERFLHTRA